MPKKPSDELDLDVRVPTTLSAYIGADGKVTLSALPEDLLPLKRRLEGLPHPDSEQDNREQSDDDARPRP